MSQIKDFFVIYFSTNPSDSYDVGGYEDGLSVWKWRL